MLQDRLLCQLHVTAYCNNLVSHMTPAASCVCKAERLQHAAYDTAASYRCFNCPHQPTHPPPQSVANKGELCMSKMECRVVHCAEAFCAHAALVSQSVANKGEPFLSGIECSEVAVRAYLRRLDIQLKARAAAVLVDACA
jgi:hypothetical protein